MTYPLARALLLPSALLALGLLGVLVRSDARARLWSASVMWLAVGLACLDTSRKYGSTGGEIMVLLLAPALWAALAPASWLSRSAAPSEPQEGSRP